MDYYIYNLDPGQAHPLLWLDKLTSAGSAKELPHRLRKPSQSLTTERRERREKKKNEEKEKEKEREKIIKIFFFF